MGFPIAEQGLVALTTMGNGYVLTVKDNNGKTVAVDLSQTMVQQLAFDCNNALAQ